MKYLCPRDFRRGEMEEKMFNSIMWKYIEEEPCVLSSILNNKEILNQIKQFSEIDALYIVAHGSSYNAAYCTAPFIRHLADIRVYTFTPSEFIYGTQAFNNEDDTRTLVLGISQTGTSSGVIKALNKAKEFNFKICSLTAKISSPIEKLADYSISLNCGNEESNAKTKGYSSTLLCLLQFAYALGLCKKKITKELYDEFVQECLEEIQSLSNLEKRIVLWCKNNQYGKNMSHVYVIGNGVHLGTAMEGMLKIMETMCIPSMYSNVMEFSHGMHRSLKPNSFVILIKTYEDSDEMTKTYDYLENKNINTLLIDLTSSNDKDNVISVPIYKTTYSLLSVSLVIQSIAAFVPELNGFDPNRNSNDDYTVCMETRVN